jgi:hypothetical protein
VFKLVITLAAAAAVLVPAAQSAGSRVVSPDDRSQARATAPALLPSSESPDDRAFDRSVSPALQRQTQAPDDRAFSRATVDRRATPTPVQVVVRRPNGFDWASATTGAAAATGLAAILAALALLGLRARRSEGPHATPTVGSA